MKVMELQSVAWGKKSITPPPRHSTALPDISVTAENNYVKRGVFIGSLNESQSYDILWQSPDTPEPVPFSPYMSG